VRILFSVLLLLSLCGCRQTEKGQGGSEVSGSGGSAGAKNAAKDLLRCTAPIATVALVEDPAGYAYMSRYSLPSPLSLMRLMMQQSGCFRVVDRSAGIDAAKREQELQDSGMLRKDQTIRKRQVIEAQYSMLTSIVFSEKNAGDSFGGVVSQLPVVGQFAGLLGNVNFKEAQTVLFLTDNETSEQVASATGSARATDLGAGGLMIGSLGGAALGGWGTTNEGKVIASALLDSFNNMVPQVQILMQKEMPAAVPTKKR
jgi:curli biogenesis system outer membrane secretion channel CsgG